MSTASCSKNHGEIYDYDPPTWARSLKVKPKVRAKLSMTPTPIHPWKLPGIPDGFEVSIKREDMIGSTFTGNKIRKLEFLLADAIDLGCDCVVTNGPFLSNHVRATVMAARELGLQSHVLIMSHGQKSDEACKANHLLSRLVGTKFIVFPHRPEVDVHEELKYVNMKMKEYASKLRKDGHKPYEIPVGGSSTIGSWGYIDGFNEMIEQGVLDRFDDIIVTVGSVGTLCGLAIAKYLTGAPIKIHGVSIHATEESIFSHINHELQTHGIEDVQAADLVEVTVDYIRGATSEELVGTIVDVTSQTGVPIDPVFNVKSVRYMLTEMQLHPERFKGTRILYIHSGGIYNLFADKVDTLVRQNPVTSRIVSSEDVFKE